MELLTQRGTEVAYDDPHVPMIRPAREHAPRTGTKSLSWNRATVKAFGAIVIAASEAAPKPE
jgi:UDP-N-acetyl-D-glucosamine dehydrogenase